MSKEILKVKVERIVSGALDTDVLVDFNHGNVIVTEQGILSVTDNDYPVVVYATGFWSKITITYKEVKP